MPRVPMITRSIQTTIANVLCLNLDNMECFSTKIVLPRTFKDEKRLMKAVEEAVNNDCVKAVHVVDTFVEEKLYGMSEKDFIDRAKILPPRQIKTKEEK